VLNNTQKYQLSIEKNSLNTKLTEEIQEYFDGLDNIGIIISNFAGLQTYSYGYFANNELLIIESNLKNLLNFLYALFHKFFVFIGPYSCRVLKLNDSRGLSPFYVVNDTNGNQHIASLSSFFLNTAGVKVKSFIIVIMFSLNSLYYFSFNCSLFILAQTVSEEYLLTNGKVVCIIVKTKLLTKLQLRFQVIVLVLF
jgi:hypothetical protein